MLIYPAIDLMDGKCVRLEEGRFESSTVYAEDPLEMARTFHAAGATWLHMVDLDGARTGTPRHAGLIREISDNTGLKVQTGGGIRTEDGAREVLDRGIDRIVLGSMAVAAPDIVSRLIGDYGAERLTLALDVVEDNGGYVVRTHGWQRSSGLALAAAMDDFCARGAKYALVTDVSRDGMLKGPNVSLYADLVRDWPDMIVQASGGVSTLDQIAALKQSGISEAIVGRAIYVGDLQLEELFDGS